MQANITPPINSLNPLQTLAEMLKPFNVATMEISFSGSGDSGEINSIEYLTGAVPREAHLTKRNRRSWRDNQALRVWSGRVPNEIRTLGNVVADLITSKLAGDWWNNDGGYGKAVVDFVNGKVSLEGNYYELRVADREFREMNLALEDV